MTERNARSIAESFISTNSLHAIRVIFADIHGVLRGRVFPAHEYLHRLHDGFRFCETIFTKDITGRSVREIPTRISEVASDIIAVPDPLTYCKAPWQSALGQVIADLFYPDGSPVPYAPRTVLRRVVEALHTRGYLPRVAAELEFYVVSPGSQRPISKYPRPYDPLDLLHPGAFLSDALSALTEMRLPIEAALREAGPGQFEINLTHGPAMLAADKTLLFKSAIKETASKHGLSATFMAKPFSKRPGSGFHVNQSLWDTDGKTNLFSSPYHDRPSALALRFVAGQLRHLPAATALFAPSMNAYKRLQSGTFTPINCSWGYDNRTVALRLPQVRGNSARIENRVPGADANPYLVIAASLAGGVLGVAHELTPPEPILNDATAQEGVVSLPRNLRDALTELEKDDLFCDLLGEDAVRLFIALKHAESLLFEQRVCQWERQLYLVS